MKMPEKKQRVKVDFETGDGLIIDHPSLISKFRYYSEWTYNVLAWAIWLSLLRPLLIIGLWYIGIKLAWFQMVELEGFRNPEFFAYGFLSIFGIFLVMFLWNRYNYFRFAGKERRTSRGEASPSDFAQYYKTSEEDIASLRDARNVDIYFPGDDTIVLDCGNDKKIEALYAPLDLKKHLDALNGEKKGKEANVK
ncbi:MAG: poly-beta-1,6-N-acetyl-D-glucosamine biosynthesis protein PgaD [Lentisphaerae bacterium GWF2_52_8]|nr:MAG: poly-beta-1,6-N-acetyl-D-glucosamine biosynthesis protein PgaD [Lentisphaerae bacterium GWF2_52_8]